MCIVFIYNQKFDTQSVSGFFSSISDNSCIIKCIPDGAHIFTAEAKAVDLDFIRNCGTKNNCIIFADSLSVLNVVNDNSLKNSQIKKRSEKYHELLVIKNLFSDQSPFI